MNEILFEYKMAGYTITLYPNRIEEARKVFGMGKTNMILVKTITNIESGVGKKLTISTMDGKKHVLEIAGKQAEDLKNKLMPLL